MIRLGELTFNSIVDHHMITLIKDILSEKIESFNSIVDHRDPQAYRPPPLSLYCHFQFYSRSSQETCSVR